ncbi:MAG: ATPase, partial [Clostridiales Family XIII bacterium]|jgi:sugar (pentulose or hexulose) kinase|nr:ATPase [Clostridiales Family XIII bacterium]
VGYNYYSGEPITCAGAGVPLFMRHPASKLALGNFCRSLLFSSVATLRLGMDILTGQGVHIGVLQGHGGFFKTEAVGQRILASALGVPVEVAKTAGEGGAWGIALLAGYLVWHRPGEGLEDWLGSNVFSRRETAREEPDEEIAAGFAQYMQLYKRGLAAERVAADALFYGAGK